MPKQLKPFIVYDGRYRKRADLVSFVVARGPRHAANYYAARCVSLGNGPHTVYVCEYDATPGPGHKMAANSNGEIRYDVTYAADGTPDARRSEKSYA